MAVAAMAAYRNDVRRFERDICDPWSSVMISSLVYCRLNESFPGTRAGISIAQPPGLYWAEYCLLYSWLISQPCLPVSDIMLVL
jgi:hypothetical protein